MCSTNLINIKMQACEFSSHFGHKISHAWNLPSLLQQFWNLDKRWVYYFSKVVNWCRDLDKSLHLNCIFFLFRGCHCSELFHPRCYLVGAIFRHMFTPAVPGVADPIPLLQTYCRMLDIGVGHHDPHPDIHQTHIPA